MQNKRTHISHAADLLPLAFEKNWLTIKSLTPFMKAIYTCYDADSTMKIVSTHQHIGKIKSLCAENKNNFNALAALTTQPISIYTLSNKVYHK